MTQPKPNTKTARDVQELSEALDAYDKVDLNMQKVLEQFDGARIVRNQIPYRVTSRQQAGGKRHYYLRAMVSAAMMKELSDLGTVVVKPPPKPRRKRA